MDGAALRHHAHKLRIELRNMAPVYRGAEDDAPPAYTPCNAAQESNADVGGRRPERGAEEAQDDESGDEYCSEAEEEEEDEDDDYEDGEDEYEDGEDYGNEYGNVDDDETLLCHPGNKHNEHRDPVHAKRTLKGAVLPQRDESEWHGDAIAKAIRAIQRQQPRNMGTNHTTSSPSVRCVPHTAPDTVSISARTTIHGNNNTLTPDFCLVGARLAHALVARLEDATPPSPVAAASAPPIPRLRRGGFVINVDCGIDINGNGNVVGTTSTPSPFLIRNSIPADHPAALAAPAPASTNTTHSATMPSGFTVPGSATKLPSAELCLNASESESMPRSCQPAPPELSTEPGGAFVDTLCHTSVPAGLETSHQQNNASTDTACHTAARATELSVGIPQRTARRKRVREREDEEDCYELKSYDGDGGEGQKLRRWRRLREWAGEEVGDGVMWKIEGKVLGLGLR